MLPNLQELSADFNGFMPAAISMPMPEAHGDYQTQLSPAICSVLPGDHPPMPSQDFWWEMTTKYPVFGTARGYSRILEEFATVAAQISLNAGMDSRYAVTTRYPPVVALPKK
jgi:hypothetical protein